MQKKRTSLRAVEGRDPGVSGGMRLLDPGSKLIGTDAFTLDIPITKMVEELKKGSKKRLGQRSRGMG